MKLRYTFFIAGDFPSSYTGPPSIVVWPHEQKIVLDDFEHWYSSFDCEILTDHCNPTWWLRGDLFGSNVEYS